MAKIPEFTQEQYQDFARSLDDGSYFQNARKWYTIVYMSILPERCYWIVMFAIASTAAFLSIISLILLLPLAPAQPILLPMRDVLRDLPMIMPLKESPYQHVNDALQRFFIREYLTRREHYSFETINANFRFVRNYSNAPVMSSYRREINPMSPKSPINRYERKIQRKITIDTINIHRIDGKDETWEEDGRYLATVFFRANEVSLAENKKSRWKAEITFDYIQLKMIQPKDLEHGKAKVIPMKFTVTDYNIIEDIVIP
ncbi:MAG: hypothetical protein EAZ74_02225 [Alphaproteobacteria bacterium]|nr:MAG: hypothetical protein EAY76_02255 [Alphaproteobacteria bacterium]TAF15236.1 MAG: hypothetical protein EAZ74_02225 [Alphaproteobacteria bacterium]TAF41056.1 MAG: hypothetical protein EAZ66_01980 [Alphaproteobacteria bacterium]TAF76310.1 MAG: hypothetical protein EAZ52_04485 [Alphaproteobacteria bacterium]